MTSPMGVPGPTRVTSTLSSCFSISVLLCLQLLLAPTRNRVGRPPRGNDFFFAFLRHHGVALAGGDDDGSSRSVAVRLLVGARREHRHVTSGRAAQQPGRPGAVAW